MSDRVFIFDTTLRDGEQSPGATMTGAEKIRLAKQLEKLGVDIIEAGFPAASQGDFEAVQSIAAAVQCQVAGLTRAFIPEIDRTWAAIKNGADPRLHIFLATSALHMKAKLNKEPSQVLDMIAASVSHARTLTDNVEFSAEDGSRSEPEFLVRAVEQAIRAGARVINIPDTVGYAVPKEYGDLIRYLIKNVPNSSEAIFAVHCHNDLGLAVANTLAALRAGARQVEGTICGIGERAGNSALEEVVMALHTRQDYFDLITNIKPEQIFPTCRMLSMITGQPIPPNKAIVGANAFAHESGVHQDGVLKDRRTYEIMTPESIGRAQSDLILGKHSGRHALQQKLEKLNLSIDKDQLDLVFSAIKTLADKKVHIYDEDIEAVVFEQVYNRPDLYALKHLSVLSGDMGVPPTAALVLTYQAPDGPREKHQASFGCGPVDALFNAINEAVGRKPSLDSFTINAITGGADALGEVTVRIMDNNLSAIGRGADPDIIVACAKAYLAALNRLIKKEEEHKCPTR